MSGIIAELMKRYGLWAILALSVASGVIWFVAHSQSKPGEKVSVLWGMVEYTKGKSPARGAPPDAGKERPATRATTEVPAAAAQPESTQSVKVSDVALGLEGCDRSRNTVVCTLSVTSESDVPAGAFMIHIGGDVRSKIVDGSGNEYFAHLAELGNQSDARSVEGGLYANIPKKARLYFDDVPSHLESIAVLEIEGFLLPGDRITATFRDIQIKKGKREIEY